jgi:hypothetical protein
MAELITSAPEMGAGIPRLHAWLLLSVVMQLYSASPPFACCVLQYATGLLVVWSKGHPIEKEAAIQEEA